MTITAFPLTWPPLFPRAKLRERGTFKTALPGALKNVDTSLRMFASDSGKKLENLTISSNVSLGVQKPADQTMAPASRMTTASGIVSRRSIGSVPGGGGGRLRADTATRPARATGLRC